LLIPLEIPNLFYLEALECFTCDADILLTVHRQCMVRITKLVHFTFGYIIFECYQNEPLCVI